MTVSPTPNSDHTLDVVRYIVWFFETLIRLWAEAIGGRRGGE